MNKDIKGIAYGVSDFESIQTRNSYYVDKTHFIPSLEAHYYTFFIRPRRFGKSLWLSILETYYDVTKKDRFEDFFHDTWIAQNRTEEQGSYLVLTFNFSEVLANPDEVRSSFEDYGRIQIEHFLDRYQDLFPENDRKSVEAESRVSSKLSALFNKAEKLGLGIYILIDEYDNFANTILSTVGEQAYQELTHGDGFYRHFFAVLKAGTGGSGGGLKRLFITGVSPVTMDDVTSGFNIGSNISLEPHFNEMVGFTEAEVRQMLQYYQEQQVFKQDLEDTVALMKLWYNNYNFSEELDEPMFNTDMVLYFVQKSIHRGKPPRELIDQNIRIDYGKLRHLMLVSRKLNGNFNQLKSIIDDEEVVSEINSSFPLEQISHPNNFMSLLYYFGLLSIVGQKRGMPLLKIPNQTVKVLMYGYIRDAFADVGTFRLDVWTLKDLFSRMAYDGEWENVFDFLADEIQKQTEIRDYLSAEKVIQGFLLAYLNISDFYITQTEREMNKGFADIFLEPFLTKYPDLPHVYLIELKYIKRSEFNEATLEAQIESAKNQLDQYLQDPIIQKQYAALNTTGLILIFNGWELVHRQAYP